MKDISLHYNQQEIKISLPDDLPTKYLTSSIPEEYYNKKEENIIIDSINNPIESPSLSELCNKYKQILLVVPDKTRFAKANIYVPIILELLKSYGIKEANIDILFANGSHSPLSLDEMKQILGRSISHPNIFQHKCEEKANMTFYGSTSYGTPVYINSLFEQNELILSTGSIVYHYFAGFGGGIKTIIPGIASRETIRTNHSLTIKGDFEYMNPACEIGELENNPLQIDFREAIALLNKKIFMLNTVLDENGKVIGAFSGNIIEAHKKGCEFVKQCFAVPISKKSDLIIASAGGYPKDIDLIQSHKSIHNAFMGLNHKGKMLMLAACTNGIGSKTYVEWFKYKDLKLTKEKMLQSYNINAHTALSTIMKNSFADIYLHSEINGELLDHLGFKLIENTLQETIDTILSSYEKLPDTYIIPKASLVVPFLK